MRIGMMLTAVALMATVGTASAQNLTYDYDKEASFGGYRIYGE